MPLPPPFGKLDYSLGCSRRCRGVSGPGSQTEPLPLPAFPPMPVPPAGFAGLTPEELRALEGHERQHLEARLQSLRNIHTLLDAAMLQINQYLTVLASLGYVYIGRWGPWSVCKEVGSYAVAKKRSLTVVVGICLP